jgi:nucleotide-binding universal stress UspA family protein
MFRRVVVPLDGSRFAEQALDCAELMAELFGARLTLVRAYAGTNQTILLVGGIEGPASAEMLDQIEETAQNARRQACRYLRLQAYRLRCHGREVEMRVLDDLPAAAIVAVTREEPDTLLVMSTHGRRGVVRLVLGSTADAVVHALHSPILLIRPVAG